MYTNKATNACALFSRGICQKFSSHSNCTYVTQSNYKTKSRRKVIHSVEHKENREAVYNIYIYSLMSKYRAEVYTITWRRGKLIHSHDDHNKLTLHWHVMSRVVTWSTFLW